MHPTNNVTRHHRNKKPLAVVRPTSRRANWLDLAGLFSGEQECLASYLALEAAEVIGGAKPANLLNLVDRQLPCGRNLHLLWLNYGQQLLTQAGLAARELRRRDDGILLLIYHPARLTAYLETPKVSNFLHHAGYRQPTGVEPILKELETRLLSGGFPHEIGAILGYPLKDVAGFMGWTRLPVTHQGPWKIYGDPRLSLDVIRACRGCRETMAERLRLGNSPYECLGQRPQADIFSM